MNTARKPAPAARRSRLGVWMEHHAWSLRASLQRLGRHPLGTALTMLVLGLALALPLTLGLVLDNARVVTRALGEGESLSVFLHPGQDAASAQALAAQVRRRADVTTVDLKSPAQGLAELSSVQGFGDALAALDSNPLPWVLLVVPRDGLDAAAVGTLATALRAAPGVDLVQDDGAFRARMHALMTLGARALLALVALLGCAVLLVVGHVVRLDIRSRADEIAVLQLAGASPRFVRRPYLYAGAIHGLGAGIVAVALVAGMEALLAAPAAQLAASYAGRLSLHGVAVAWLALVPLAAAVLGWCGARLVGTRRLGATVPR